MKVAFVLILLFLTAICRAETGDIQIKLSTGTLIVPPAYQLIGDKVDLIVHFHGAEATVRENLSQSGKKACLLVINYSGLSEAYAKPFRDNTQLFSQLLGEARQKLAIQFGKPVRIRKLVVTSFSAGYGAVREIIKDYKTVGLINDIVLADSLYASYVVVNGKNVVSPTQMKDFNNFAQLAAGKRKTMIVTHSQLVPGTYASTIETADAMIAAAHAVRVKAVGTDGTGMTLESKADRGNFHVRSYQGTTGDDHLNHLRQMQEALKLTSLP